MRVPRKVKKWNKKWGWTLHFDKAGRAYWTRDTRIPGFRHNW